MHPANQEILNNILKNEIKPINEDLLISFDSDKSKKSKKSNKSGNRNESIIETKPKLNFFLISSLIYNEKYSKLFNISQES
jgi:hypothetical protein